MILQRGDVVLVSHRRLFPEDRPRFFTGTVDHYEDGIVRVTGHSWYREPRDITVKCKPGKRTKIFAIASGTLMVYALGPEVDSENLELVAAPSGEIWLQDGKGFRLNLAEYEAARIGL